MIDMISFDFRCLQQTDISVVPSILDSAIVEQEKIVCIYSNEDEHLIFTTKKIVVIREKRDIRPREMFFLTNRIYFFTLKYPVSIINGRFNNMEIHTEFGPMKLSFNMNIDITPLVKYIAGLVH